MTRTFHDQWFGQSNTTILPHRDTAAEGSTRVSYHGDKSDFKNKVIPEQ